MAVCMIYVRIIVSCSHHLGGASSLRSGGHRSSSFWSNQFGFVVSRLVSLFPWGVSDQLIKFQVGNKTIGSCCIHFRKKGFSSFTRLCRKVLINMYVSSSHFFCILKNHVSVFMTKKLNNRSMLLSSVRVTCTVGSLYDHINGIQIEVGGDGRR